MPSRSLVAVYPTLAMAAEAAERLAALGVDPHRLHTLRLRPSKRYAQALRPIEPSRASTGAQLGLIIGGLLGVLSGAGVLRVPGLGPLLDPSVGMAMLSGVFLGLVGLMAGAAIGGFVGGLLPASQSGAARLLSEEGHGALVIEPHDDVHLLVGWLDDALMFGEVSEPEDPASHRRGESLADAETEIIEHRDHWNRYL